MRLYRAQFNKRQLFNQVLKQDYILEVFFFLVDIITLVDIIFFCLFNVHGPQS